MEKLRKDERLIAIRHRAGYDAFFVVFVILTVLMGLGLFVDMRLFFFPPVILLLPAFVGANVFVIRLWQGGYYTSMREEIGRRPSLHQRMKWVVVGQGVFFAVATYLGNRYVMPGIMGAEMVTERNLWFDVGAAVFSGVFFALFMWFLSYRRYRPKDMQKEQE